jgi:hypothetical protein
MARQAKCFKLEIGGRQETVSLDRLKPHLGLASVKKSASGMFKNPLIVLTFTRQKGSSATFSSYLALLV